MDSESFQFDLPQSLQVKLCRHMSSHHLMLLLCGPIERSHQYGPILSDLELELHRLQSICFFAEQNVDYR